MRAQPPLIETLETRQLLSAGQLDPTFGTGGKVTTDLGLAGANGVAIQADGKIVASTWGDTHESLNLARYNTDGSLDTSFGGGDGIVTEDFGFGGMTELDKMVVGADGKLIISGRGYANNANHQFVARFNTDGTVDTTFGDDGIVVFATGNVVAGSALGLVWTNGGAVLAAQADGKILVGVVRGDNTSDTDPDLTLIRLTSTGEYDSTFGGGDGIAQVDLGLVEVPIDIALQADGRIIVAADGYTIHHENGGVAPRSHAAYLIRFNANGSVDTTFGTGGVVTEAAANEQIRATKVAIALDGKILFLATDTSFTAGGAYASRLARYDTDGTRDTTFGTAGLLTFAGTGHVYSDLLVQPDGKLLLSGGDTGIVSERRSADGELDETYGVNGRTEVEFSNHSGWASAAALQQDGGVVIAGFSTRTPLTSGNSSNVAITRLTGDAGAAGSRFARPATLRRGKDQQPEYAGKQAAKTRSPKRIAMDELAERLARHLRVQRRAAAQAATERLARHERVQRRIADLAHAAASPVFTFSTALIVA